MKKSIFTMAMVVFLAGALVFGIFGSAMAETIEISGESLFPYFVTIGYVDDIAKGISDDGTIACYNYGPKTITTWNKNSGVATIESYANSPDGSQIVPEFMVRHGVIVGKKIFKNWFVPDGLETSVTVTSNKLVCVQTSGIIADAKSAENGSVVYILIRESPRLLFVVVDMQAAKTIITDLKVENFFSEWDTAVNYSGGAIYLGDDDIPYVYMSSVGTQNDHQGISKPVSQIINFKLSRNGQLMHDEVLYATSRGDNVTGCSEGFIFGTDKGSPFILKKGWGDIRKLPVYWEDKRYAYQEGVPVGIFGGSLLAGNMADNVVFFRNTDEVSTTIVLSFDQRMNVVSVNKNNTVFLFCGGSEYSQCIGYSLSIN